jgi:hypothetical protein
MKGNNTDMPGNNETTNPTGSNPCRTANNPQQIEVSCAADTTATQETAESEGAQVKFPKRIKHRGRVLATIYGKCEGRDSYRVAWQVAGRRHMASFRTYSEAKRHADELVKDLAKGSQVTALNPAQARDALAALERLADFYRVTDRRVSLLAAVSEFAEASAKLHGRNLGEVVTGYLNTVATIKRVDLAAAVKEFVDGRETETKSVNGKRPEMSKSYFVNTKLWLGWFEKTFPGTAVCDLTKDHLDLFMAGRSHLAAKSKNHLRATVKMFLNWCIKKDYLPANHRLMDAPGMKRQKADSGETDFYRPGEFRAMLDAADDAMRPIIALQGLSGRDSAPSGDHTDRRLS